MPVNTDAASASTNLLYIISDDKHFCAELRAHLDPLKYRVEITRDLASFESACKCKKPKLILFDVNSRQSNEITAFITKLQNGVTHHPPVIGLGEGNDIEQRLHATRCATSRYMPKPIDPAQLIQSIDDLLVTTSGSAFRILMIDDDIDILNVYSEMLRSAGMLTHTLSDPYQGLSKLEEFKPDLILLDLHMPKLSGLELSQIIRQDSRYDHIPIVFLSVETNTTIQHRIFNAGADGFVTKPLTNPQIFKAEIRVRAARGRRSKRISDAYLSTLRESSSRQKVLDEHAIVVITNTDGEIIFVNQKACESSGYESHEQVGQHRDLHEAEQGSVSQSSEMWASLSAGNTWSGIFCNRRKDNSKYWTNTTIVPFIDDTGTPYQYVSASTDITDIKLSEERLRRSQSYANIGTWDTDLETGEDYWSEHVKRLLGYDDTSENYSTEAFFDSIHRKDAAMVTDAIQACIKGNKPYDIEYRILWPDGSLHWLHGKGDVLLDKETGRATNMLGFGQDITERKSLEIELYRHKSAMDASMYSMSILNLDETFRYVNPAWATLHGYDDVSLIETKDWRMLVPKDHHSQYIDEIFPALQKTGHWHGESKSLRKDGSSFHQRLFLDVLVEAHGIVCTIQDITDEQKHEANLLNAVEDAEKANHAKSRFLSNMSHELRTPLNAILGFGQLIQLDADEADLHAITEYSGEIISAGNHLLALINEVLDLAKIESGNVEAKLEAVDIYALVDDCVSLLAPLSNDKEVEIITPPQDQTPEPLCYADPTLTKQVLINLIGNAIKYNRANGTVSITCQAMDNNTIRISVADTGRGLSKKQQAHLFEPFQRFIPDHQKNSIEGTGIGLTITKNIVELMQGTIGFESQFKKGSTFWIELPVARHALNQTHVDSPSTGTTDERTSAQARTILYIEDNAANQRLMKRFLEYSNEITLITAEEPFSGLKLAESKVPNLILLDINLPTMDGFEVKKRLSKNAITRDIPVIAVSANAMQEDIDKALNAGFEHYISKPIDLSLMIKAIEDVFDA